MTNEEYKKGLEKDIEDGVKKLNEILAMRDEAIQRTEQAEKGALKQDGYIEGLRSQLKKFEEKEVTKKNASGK